MLTFIWFQLEYWFYHFLFRYELNTKKQCSLLKSIPFHFEKTTKENFCQITNDIVFSLNSFEFNTFDWSWTKTNKWFFRLYSKIWDSHRNKRIKVTEMLIKKSNEFFFFSSSNHWRRTKIENHSIFNVHSPRIQWRRN